MSDAPRNRYLLLWDAVLLAGAPFFAYLVRFEGAQWSPEDARTLLFYSVGAVTLKVGLFFVLGLYKHLWRDPTATNVFKIIQAAVVAQLACAALGFFVLPGLGLTAVRVPVSVVLLDWFVTVSILALPRAVMQWFFQWRQRQQWGSGKRVLIVGAGEAGGMILKELYGNPQLGLTPAGFVDDDPRKQNRRLSDLPVFGPISDLGKVVEREQISEIIIAIPSAPGKVIRKVVQSAHEVGVPTRTAPALFEILSGRVGVSALRNVEIHDLLRREPISTDLDAVRSMVEGQTVLVTGSGGSIGSELCRQLAELGPAQLVLFGHGENSIFDAMQDLQTSYPDLALAPVIADVRDDVRTRALFEHYRPHAVFHAAAHKHVPLMEQNVVEAVTNNVRGTRNVLVAALVVGTEHFVLVSTDKAVRPTSVMGASKRAAEMLVQDMASTYGRNFVSVRFGNVLGSRGSVVPTFLRQIRAGGPVTVTHPEMNRYFLTIPEAVQLVLQAGALGRGGEVFVLDMGEPVKIVDLAKDLIRLSGLEVGTDIEIQFTGIRPGERLHEEIVFRGESVVMTEHPKVLRVRNEVPGPDVAALVEELIQASEVHASDERLKSILQTLVTDQGGREVEGHVPDRRSLWVPRFGKPIAESHPT